MGEEYIGDEVHALTKCCRSKIRRSNCTKKLHKILAKANEEESDPEDLDSNQDIWQMMKKIQYLRVPQQRLVWREVATLMAGIDMEIKKPKRSVKKKSHRKPKLYKNTTMVRSRKNWEKGKPIPEEEAAKRTPCMSPCRRQ